MHLRCVRVTKIICDFEIRTQIITCCIGALIEERRRERKREARKKVKKKLLANNQSNESQVLSIKYGESLYYIQMKIIEKKSNTFDYENDGKKDVESLAYIV